VCSYSWRVPFTTAGRLRVVASQDIGELGAKESSAVTYNWKWYYHIAGFVLWVVLISALLLVKANRNRRAWLILIPLLIVNLLFLIFKQILPFSAADAERFNMFFDSLTIGVSLLWLLGHKIGGRSGFTTFLLALVIMAGVCVVGTASYGMTEFSPQTWSILTLFAVSVFSMLLGFVLSGWRCQKRFSRLRFMWCLAVWVVAVCMAGMLVLYAIMMISVSNFSLSLAKLAIVVFTTGMGLGLFLYVMLFPYVILALRSSFFGERFYACLRLKSMAGAAGPAAESGSPDEQEAAPEALEDSDSD
jgi:hypothetical protein